jgi:branched-chain amino acid aminotransferase
MEEYIYLNGNFVRENEAKISVFDRGFLYGDGLFETMRAYQEKVFMLEDHLLRLYNSAKILKIPLRQEKGDLKGAVEKLIKLNRLSDAYLRITVSRGRHSGRLTFDDKFNPTIVIMAKKLSHYPFEDYLKGIRVAIVDIRQNSFSPLSNHKSLSYLSYILAKEEARLKEAKEAILLNSEGLVAEGATSNIFLARKGKIYTPSESDHILPGITRKVVLSIMDKLKLRVKEGDIAPKELFRADEIFIANSIIEVMPVREVNDNIIGDGKPGNICQSLKEAYRRLASSSLR